MHPSTKLWDNLCSTFCIILLTDTQTDKCRGNYNFVGEVINTTFAKEFNLFILIVSLNHYKPNISQLHTVSLLVQHLLPSGWDWMVYKLILNPFWVVASSFLLVTLRSLQRSYLRLGCCQGHLWHSHPTHRTHTHTVTKKCGCYLIAHVSPVYKSTWGWLSSIKLFS